MDSGGKSRVRLEVCTGLGLFIVFHAWLFVFKWKNVLCTQDDGDRWRTAVLKGLRSKPVWTKQTQGALHRFCLNKFTHSWETQVPRKTTFVTFSVLGIACRASWQWRTSQQKGTGRKVSSCQQLFMWPLNVKLAISECFQFLCKGRSSVTCGVRASRELSCLCIHRITSESPASPAPQRSSAAFEGPGLLFLWAPAARLCRKFHLNSGSVCEVVYRSCFGVLKTIPALGPDPKHNSCFIFHQTGAAAEETVELPTVVHVTLWFVHVCSKLQVWRKSEYLSVSEGNPTTGCNSRKVRRCFGVHLQTRGIDWFCRRPRGPRWDRKLPGAAVNDRFESHSARFTGDLNDGHGYVWKPTGWERCSFPVCGGRVPARIHGVLNPCLTDTVEPVGVVQTAALTLGH